MQKKSMKTLKRQNSLFFPLWNQLRGAKNKENNEIFANLKRELLKIFTYFSLSRGVPCESLRPKDSKNVVLLGSSSF